MSPSVWKTTVSGWSGGGAHTETIGFKNATRVDALLSDLCVRHGVCLSPDDFDALVRDPPGELDAFVDAILIADGQDPVMADKELRRVLTAALRDWIFDDGHGKGSASGLPLLPPA